MSMRCGIVFIMMSIKNFNTLHIGKYFIRRRYNFHYANDRLSEHADLISEILTGISDYWKNKLRGITKTQAIDMIPKLINNILGFELGAKRSTSKSPTLVDSVVEYKRDHPEKIIFVRNGKFYETYGVDAVMLVNYCGLNPMGQDARAGCPDANVQQTLNCLTDEGFSVAIYEEAADTTVEIKKPGLKRRFLKQIVSPASKIYMNDLCLRQDDVHFPDNLPIWGIQCSVDYYTVHFVYLDVQKIVIFERMTAEGVKLLHDRFSSLEPLYCDPESKSSLSWCLPLSKVVISGYSEADFSVMLMRYIFQANDIDATTTTFEILKHPYKNRPRPIYSSTAAQIGLLANPNVPYLIQYLLPPKTYRNAHSERFLLKWISFPPPCSVAIKMQNLCRHISELPIALPIYKPVQIGKIESLLRAKECNKQTFLDILYNVQKVLHVLEAILRDCNHPYAAVIDSLVPVVEYESMMNGRVDLNKLQEGCTRIIRNITCVIALSSDGDQCNTDGNGLIPDDFFLNNEKFFRNIVNPAHPNVTSLYSNIKEAANTVINTVRNEFRVIENNDVRPRRMTDIIEFGVNNNALTISSKNFKLMDNPDKFIKAKDTKKSGPDRFTTECVVAAEAKYIDETSKAEYIIRGLLQKLCTDLMKDLESIIICAHWAVVVTAVYLHVKEATEKNWILPRIEEFPPNSISSSTVQNRLVLKELTPYWLKRKSTFPLAPWENTDTVANGQFANLGKVELNDAHGITNEAEEIINTGTPNDVDLGLYLLTAPNMSGKSTLMRSVLVAALLANCGLFVPASEATVPFFDNYFLRTSSYDMPSSGKSAFGSEMDDMRVLLRDITLQSLIMIDELGKGTSSKDGASMAGALLEHIDAIGCAGIFATHLHELFDLPLQLSRTQNKRMGVRHRSDTDSIMWTYKLEDGKCRDSLAVYTARYYKIPEFILTRSNQLARIFDDKCRAGSTSISSILDYSDTTMATAPSSRKGANRIKTSNYSRQTELSAEDQTIPVFQSEQNFHSFDSSDSDITSIKSLQRVIRLPEMTSDIDPFLNVVPKAVEIVQNVDTETGSDADNDLSQLSVIKPKRVRTKNSTRAKSIISTEIISSVDTDQVIHLDATSSFTAEAQTDFNTYALTDCSIEFAAKHRSDADASEVRIENNHTTMTIAVEQNVALPSYTDSVACDAVQLELQAAAECNIDDISKHATAVTFTTLFAPTETSNDINASNSANEVAPKVNSTVTTQLSLSGESLSHTMAESCEPPIVTDVHFVNNVPSYNLKDVEKVLQRISGVKPAFLEADVHPPNQLNGVSCSYVLHITKRGKPDAFYVGETENIFQRLIVHRQSWEGCIIKAAVMRAPNKSSARGVESLLISKLKSMGYLVEKSTDENHRQFGRAT